MNAKLINDRENKAIDLFRRFISVEEFTQIWGNERSAKIMITKLSKRKLIQLSQKKYFVTDKGASYQYHSGFR
jgi:hypothetical protein